MREYKNLKLNKKAVSLSILLLTLSSLVLSGLSLFYFYSLNNEINEIIDLHTNIDKIYEKKDLVDFYVNDIFENCVKDFEITSSEQAFLENFKNTLKNYKDENGNYFVEELQQLESVNEENIDINENTLTLHLTISIKEEWPDIKTVYVYEKRFEKVFK